MTNVALIGFMGSGKSTVGQALAHELDKVYVDTDAIVEHKAKMSIAEIFAREGEPAFRALEGEVVQALCRESDLVIATGGGAFMTEVVRRSLLETALVAFLEAPFDALWERIKGDPQRPLLAGDDAYERMQALYTARLPVYRQAHVSVDAARPPAEVVKELVEVYHAYRQRGGEPGQSRPR